MKDALKTAETVDKTVAEEDAEDRTERARTMAGGLYLSSEIALNTGESPDPSDPAQESFYSDEPGDTDPECNPVAANEERTEYAKARPKRTIIAPTCMEETLFIFEHLKFLKIEQLIYCFFLLYYSRLYVRLSFI